MKSNLTDAQEQQIAAKWREGLTDIEIEALVGCSQDDIRDVAARRCGTPSDREDRRIATMQRQKALLAHKCPDCLILLNHAAGCPRPDCDRFDAATVNGRPEVTLGGVASNG